MTIHFTGRATRILSVMCACWFITVASGCVLLEKCNAFRVVESYEPLSHVDVAFPPFIRVADDTQNPGRQIPGLAGRVWLFAEEGRKLAIARGMIEAELYDMTPVASGGLAVKLVQWKFHPSDLHQLRREDKIGMGYSLFLPWEEYRPEVKRVQLRLTYTDEKGVRHAAQPSTMTLRGMEEAPQVHVEQRTNVPLTQLKK